MHLGRKKLGSAAAGLALVAVVGLIPSSPAQAKPDIGTVQQRVDTLYRQAEQASERYNNARLQLADLQRDLDVLRGDQARQDKALAQVRDRVRDSIVSQYEGQNLSAVGEMVIADDPSAFLQKLATMSSYDELQRQMYDTYAAQAKALAIRTEATSKRAAQLAALRTELADEKRTVDAKLAQAQSLLADLKEQERDAILSRGSVRIPSDVPASGRASAAVAYAMAQVNDAYVYGAAGPNAFDCSGLTMMAWAQAGVALPHSSSAQYSSGPHIAESDLQPGDLVFYYSPISHVGMYIGNGMIVHAANPGTGVAVSSLHSMPYVGAVRPG